MIPGPMGLLELSISMPWYRTRNLLKRAKVKKLVSLFKIVVLNVAQFFHGREIDFESLFLLEKREVDKPGLAQIFLFI